MTITENITFMGYNELNDFSDGIIAFCCDEFEIKYYHPWNQSELSTEHDNTSTINDRLRLKSIPTLTEAMPFVLFTAHRTGACVEGWFGLEAQEVHLIDSTQAKSHLDLTSLSISASEFAQIGECSISPNPTDGLIHIITSEQILSLSVYDGIGTLIDQVFLSGPAYDFFDLPSGSYFIQVQTKQSIFTFKVIKS